MAFADTIRAIPYTPRTQTASGFLPPMLRAMGHILYLTGCLADENMTVSDEEAINELQSATQHWLNRTATTATSTAINERASVIGVAIDEAISEYTSWPEDQRTQNLRDLANRIVAFSCHLDRELVGLTTSDPGSSL
jgi:hypothetical protein